MMDSVNHNYSVSIILAAYNAEKSILKSVNSLRSQSLKAIEIIIVNDASTDSTLQIVNSIALEDSRIHLINLEKNTGVYGARAAGIKMASAPWIGFLDADDLARPEMFEILLKNAVESHSDIVLCGSDRVSQTGEVLSKKVAFSEMELIESNIFERFCKLEFGTGALWNKLYRSSIIKKWGAISHPWRQDTNEDVLINIGAFYEASKVVVLKEVLHEYTFNEFSVTSTKDNQSAFILLIKAYFLSLKIFIELPKKDLYLIVELYRRQLDWSNYRIEEISESLMTSEVSKLIAEAEYSLPGACLLLMPRRPARFVPESRFTLKLSRIKQYIKKMTRFIKVSK